MLTNSYEGVLENWKVRLICQRARRMGFRGFELDDVQQQVALALLDFCLMKQNPTAPTRRRRSRP